MVVEWSFEMHQQKDTCHTIKDLSPEEKQDSRKYLKQHRQKRKVDAELLQRAWYTAHKIAARLYEKFGATQVAVFGSLAQQNLFSERSDIDIVVWGLSSDEYLNAVSETIGFSQEFKIDLVKYEDCKGLFLERIEKQAIPIQKDNTDVIISSQITIKERVPDTFAQTELVQRISDRFTNVKEAVTRIDHAVQNLKDAPDRYRRSIEVEISRYLYDFYKQLENIFERIAQDVDKVVPKGEQWHKDLLQQMSEPNTVRPPVFSQETYLALKKLLGFRHVFLYIYGDELDYDKMLINATLVKEVFPILFKEIDIFIVFLKKEEND